MKAYTQSLVLQNAAVATGTGAVMDVGGFAVVAVQVTIATTATITFEANIGGGTMTALSATNLATGAVATTATVTGVYLCNVAALTGFQARISTWGSGAVTAIAFASSESGGTWLMSPLAFAVDVTLTRPSDTTTYAINDEVTDTGGAIRTITGAARASGGVCRLVSATCIDSSAVAVRPQIAAFLFDTTSTPATDNAAFAPTDGVMLTCVGILPFNVWYLGDDTAGATGNGMSPYLGPPLELKTAASANLFFRVKIYNAYVPVSAETLTFRFVFVQY